MFQQFKNIFPTSTSLNIRSLADSVGLNEEEWRTRGMEGLVALRSELQSFNSLLTNRSDTSIDQTSKQASTTNDSLCETEKVITRIELHREAIREGTVNNVQKAKVADDGLRALLSKCQQLNDIGITMTNVPNLMESTRQEMKAATSRALALKAKLVALEDRIDQVCVEYDQREMEEWKQLQEANLQKEMAEKRQGLAARQAQLDQIYEEHMERQAKERLELYDVNFKSELEDYRRRRETEVSSLYNNHSSNRTVTTTLENLKLEGNHDDLNHFLIDDEDDNNGDDRTPDGHKDLEAKEPTGKATRVPEDHQSDSSDDDGGAHIEILADEDYESD
ncbi:hypothetical protein [Absidia glauca]|uniref:Uncharacterized protein n=1 Tax=Absidia glauca TaxID=4829 RepID=A0A168T9P5_ABSGL|nr:hypothetical protein [Absidia glauca]